VSVCDVNRFDQHEWVNDIVTGAVTGVVSGAIGAMLVPDPGFSDAMVFGGIIALVVGMMNQPLRWLLNQRPTASHAPPQSKNEESKS
jgi:hypothetical protein